MFSGIGIVPGNKSLLVLNAGQKMRADSENVLYRMHRIHFAGYTEEEENQMYGFLERIKNLEEYEDGNE